MTEKKRSGYARLLVPYLRQEGLLTDEEFEWIVTSLAVKSRDERVEYIISTLKRKGPRVMVKFMSAFRRSVETTTSCDMGNEYLLNEVLAKVQVPVMVPP